MLNLAEADQAVDKFISEIDKRKDEFGPILKYGGLIAMLYLGYKIWRHSHAK